MSVLVVIPARYESSRYPGKPLVELRGANGKSLSLIRRSWDAACHIKGVDKVVVATDDERIKAAAEAFGAEVVMTASTCQNGTERCAEVARSLGEFDIVINFQGDALLTPPWFVDDLIGAMHNQDIPVATPVLRCDAEALNGFKNDRKHDRVGGTTVVFDRDGKALYFSKEVLPHTNRRFDHADDIPVFHHVGVYAYRSDALCQYDRWPEGRLEHWEKLEQLRFMENGVQIQCVEVDAKGQAFWELNNPSDVAIIETILSDQGME